ncbi:uncharacterized protein METZ01_LOCUS236814 [marine metagenome]|uniref:Uncharacterized protein n=1 Tax=marine metagenome TaxID=408172 RepID=A0A382H9L0_9ZZZZ
MVLIEVVSLYTDFPLRVSEEKDNIASPAGKKRKPAEYSSSSPTKSGLFAHMEVNNKMNT